jgi:hypothetical protein
VAVHPLHPALVVTAAVLVPVSLLRSPRSPTHGRALCSCGRIHTAQGPRPGRRRVLHSRHLI